MHFEDFCLGAVHSCHVSGAKKGPQLTRLFTREYVLLYIYIYIYVYIHIRVYIYIYICIKYIFIYIYTHTYHLSSHRDAVELHSLFHTRVLYSKICVGLAARQRCPEDAVLQAQVVSRQLYTVAAACQFSLVL